MCCANHGNAAHAILPTHAQLQAARLPLSLHYTCFSLSWASFNSITLFLPIIPALCELCSALCEEQSRQMKQRVLSSHVWKERLRLLIEISGEGISSLVASGRGAAKCHPVLYKKMRWTDDMKTCVRACARVLTSGCACVRSFTRVKQAVNRSHKSANHVLMATPTFLIRHIK